MPNRDPPRPGVQPVGTRAVGVPNTSLHRRGPAPRGDEPGGRGEVRVRHERASSACLGDRRCRQEHRLRRCRRYPGVGEGYPDGTHVGAPRRRFAFGGRTRVLDTFPTAERSRSPPGPAGTREDSPASRSCGRWSHLAAQAASPVRLLQHIVWTALVRTGAKLQTRVHQIVNDEDRALTERFGQSLFERSDCSLVSTSRAEDSRRATTDLGYMHGHMLTADEDVDGDTRIVCVGPRACLA